MYTFGYGEKKDSDVTLHRKQNHIQNEDYIYIPYNAVSNHGIGAG